MADRKAQPYIIEVPPGTDAALSVQLEHVQLDFEALFQDNANAASFLSDDLDTLLGGLSDGYLTNASGALTIQVVPIPAEDGGTGQTSYTIGDLLYASAATTLSKLADVATGNALISGGVATAPSWGKIELTTHVSGTLPIGNGGTNSATALSGSTIMISNGSAIVQGAAGTSSTVLHGNAAGAPTYGAVALASEVSGDLPFANLTPATAASRLLGRGSAAGAGDFEEIALGANLTMSGTSLAVSGVVTGPAGADTQVQFNDGGSFGGDAGLTYNKTTDTLTIAGDLNVAATKKIYLDGGGNTYITEASADFIAAYAGATELQRWNYNAGNPFVEFKNAHVTVDPLKQLYLDGGSNTYLYESVADNIRIVTGGTARIDVGTNLNLLQTNTNLILQATAKAYLDGGGDTYLHESASNTVGLVAGGTTSITYTGAGVGVFTAPVSGVTLAVLASGAFPTLTGATVAIQDANTTNEATQTGGTLTAINTRNANGAVLSMWQATGAIPNNQLALYATGSDAAFQSRVYNTGAASDILLNPSGGNVGIGTTGPTTKLDVNGNINLSASGAIVDIPNGTGIYRLGSWDIVSFSGTKAIFGGITASQFASVGIYVGGSERLFVDSSGNVGISAAKKFYLDGGSNTYIHESSADVLDLVAGGNTRATVNSTGLITPGRLSMQGQFAFDSLISPASFAGTQNDYSPTGWSTANIVRLDGNTSPVITGLAYTFDHDTKVLINVGTTTISFSHDSASSTAANRLYCPSGVTLSVVQHEAVMIWYDAGSARWRLMLNGR